MRIWKNLFGKGDKIDVNEIAISPSLLLGQGVISEIGSNPYGRYIRYGDGTQICTGSVEVDISEWSFNAGRSTLPKEFIGRYTIAFSRYSPSVSNRNEMVALGSIVPSSSSNSEVAFGVGSPSSVSKVFTLQYTAIGRWY